MKINVGCCDLPLPKPWINVDNMVNQHARPDIVLDGRELDNHFPLNSVEEIYAGHFLEHLTPTEAENWFSMCYRLLEGDGKLCVTVPDFRFIVKGYLEGDPGFAVKDLLETYIFSYRQESLHRSLWDVDSVVDIFGRHGFHDIREMDRMEDPRVAYGVPWQLVVEGVK